MEPTQGRDGLQAGARTHPRGGERLQLTLRRQVRSLPPGLLQERHQSRRRQRRRCNRALVPQAQASGSRPYRRTTAKGRFTQIRTRTLAVVSRPCNEGDEGQVRKGREERPQDHKVPKGKIPADADLVVTLNHKEGIGYYLPDERRWVVSFRSSTMHEE